jgi:hypothetical protein
MGIFDVFKTPKAPKPPDPKVVAAAQTGSNVATATANSYLNNVNQVGPDGRVTYSSDGMQTITDPSTGQSYQVPRWTQTTSLSPTGQQIYDINNQTDLNLATMGRDQSAKVSDLLSRPVDLSNEATEGRLFDLGRKRYDPQQAQQLEGLRNRLSQQGIGIGTEAYDREMTNFNQGWNDRYNQLMLTGRAQAAQEALTERNQPLNEIIGIGSGTQIGLPQFAAPTNNYGIPGTDFAGITANNYNQQMNQYNQQMGARNAALGGLFGLAGAGVTGAMGMNWGGSPASIY